MVHESLWNEINFYLVNAVNIYDNFCILEQNLARRMDVSEWLISYAKNVIHLMARRIECMFSYVRRFGNM
jgi:hypothetical protein